MGLSMTTRLYGCVEAGGTKFIVGVVNHEGEVLDRTRIETRGPDETLGAATGWLMDARSRLGEFSALGVASFGPLALNRDAPDWGYITSTPKPGWSHTDFGGRLARSLGIPVGFDTDVNGAALAEARWGAGRGQRICTYLTIGTGIGGGTVANGSPLQGLGHPEMGHVRPPRHPDDLDFAGVCPFHGDCYEGLASGPAIQARWGARLSELTADHPAHGIIAWYLGHLTLSLQAMLTPGRIILGGGVMETPGLIHEVRRVARQLGGGYFRGSPEEVIVPPELGDRLGLLAGLALAMDADACPTPPGRPG